MRFAKQLLFFFLLHAFSLCFYCVVLTFARYWRKGEIVSFFLAKTRKSKSQFKWIVAQKWKNTHAEAETNDKTKKWDFTSRIYDSTISDDEHRSVFLRVLFFFRSLLKSLGGLINCVPICLNYNLQLYKIFLPHLCLCLAFLYLLFQRQLFFKNPNVSQRERNICIVFFHSHLMCM